MSVTHYRGQRHQDRCCVWYCEDGHFKPLQARFDLLKRPAAGYEWSYSGAGPLRLAFAILAHRLGAELALLHYEKFMKDVFARMPACPSWDLPVEVIDQWFSDQDLVLGHPNIPPNPPKGGTP